jgi:nucleotide-binding universal stress UspA family protein
MAERSGFRRVVVGVDGSPNARRAARFLARLRPPRGSRVVCLRVVEPLRIPSTPLMPSRMRGQIAGQARAMEQQRLQQARRHVQTMAARLSRAGWRAAGVVRSGIPLAELRAEARRIRADAVVVGARGAGAMKRVLLGSVAEGILKHGPFDVLVVK